MSRRHALIAGVAALAIVPLAALVRIGWDPLADLDRSADNRANHLVHAHPALLTWVRATTHLGDPLTVTALAAAAALGCWLADRRRDAIYLLAVRVVALLAGTVVKHIVARARPNLAEPIAHASGYSFPSGHALGSAAAYLSVALVLATGRPAVGRVLIPLAALIAAVVGTTRVLLGVHFPSDVVAGLLLGWAIALLGRPWQRTVPMQSQTSTPVVS